MRHDTWSKERHNPATGPLKGEFIENSDAGREALEKFREKMRASKLVRFWEIPKELGIEVLVSLSDLKRRNNAIGWVRGDAAVDAEEALEISRLRKQIEVLRAENQEIVDSGPQSGRFVPLKSFFASHKRQGRSFDFGEVIGNFLTDDGTIGTIGKETSVKAVSKSLNGRETDAKILIRLLVSEGILDEWAYGYELNENIPISELLVEFM